MPGTDNDRIAPAGSGAPSPGRLAALAGAVALLPGLAVLYYFPITSVLPAPAAALLLFALVFVCTAGALAWAWRGAPKAACEPDPLAALAMRIFEISNEAVLITDASARIVEVNPAFTEITGYARDEVLGQNPGIMKSGLHEAEFYGEMWGSLRQNGQWRGEVWDRRKDGEVFAKWLSISALRDEAGNVQKYIGIFSDITAIKETEKHHEFLAHYDSLTRLPNRLLFNDRMEQAMLSALRGGRSMALMFLDLDRFKNVNDTLGHSTGDRLLMAVADKLRDAVRKNDTVARFGGDEFAVILSDIRGPSDAAQVAEKINLSLAEPIMAGKHEILTSASIGITMYPQDADKRDALLRNADIAMYHAKNHGRDRYQFYTARMQETVNERIRVEQNLRAALEGGEMVLYYQPQVSLHSGAIIGMEALIRRQEKEWLVPPAVFMGVAEETGLIVDICDWTLVKSCSDAARWFADGVPQVRVAVNISALQFEQRGFVERVRQILKETGLSPSLLELELTERAIMKSSDAALEKMRSLKELGILLSIDDFGTGYSSLSYLKDFPVDKLKVDLSFVHAIGRGREGEAIVRTIISLAHNLGMVVIAEGVEKREQLDFLMKEGCDEMQGFYFSFPHPEEQFVRMLRKGRTLSDIGKPE